MSIEFEYRQADLADVCTPEYLDPKLRVGGMYVIIVLILFFVLKGAKNGVLYHRFAAFPFHAPDAERTYRMDKGAVPMKICDARGNCQ